MVLLRSSASAIRGRHPRAGDNGGRRCSKNCSACIDEHDGVLGARADPANSMVRWPAETRSPYLNGIAFLDAFAVKSVPFLLPRSSTCHCPSRRKRQMLAGKPGVVGIAQLIGAGTAERNAVTIQGDVLVWPSRSRMTSSRGVAWAGAVKVLAYHSCAGPLGSAFCPSGLKGRGQPDDNLLCRLYLTGWIT